MTVADDLHFARAAARLHMAQSPLRRQVRLLERDLGVRLFASRASAVRDAAAGACFQAGSGAGLLPL